MQFWHLLPSFVSSEERVPTLHGVLEDRDRYDGEIVTIAHRICTAFVDFRISVIFKIKKTFEGRTVLMYSYWK